VLRGSRTKKVNQSLIKTFDTPTLNTLVDFNVELRMSPLRIVRRKRTLSCHPTFDPNVVIVTIHPGMPEAYLDVVLNSKPHGIVLRAYGPGMLPERIFPWLERVTKAQIPIVITSQALRGKIDLHRYRKQLTLERLGLISGKDMTYECATAKLMWGLTRVKSMHALQELMEKSLVGELSE